MATRSTPRIQFDGHRMAEDAASRGWGPQDLAARTRGRLSQRTVYRFLANEVQTTRTAKILSDVLGYSIRRYLVSSREAVAR